MAFYEPGRPGKAEADAPKTKEEVKAEIIDFVRFLIIAVIVVVVVLNFVIINATIPSGSMENTIMTGDRIIGLRLAYIRNDPKRYDIVIFRYPDNEKSLFIKRVIGLPEETVVISEGKVYILPEDADSSAVSDSELIDSPMMFEGTIMLDDSFCPETPKGGGYYDGVFRVPEGLTDRDILDMMKRDYGILVAGCFDVLAGKVLRIGHMGENANVPDVAETLDALGRTLVCLGVDLRADMKSVFLNSLRG